MSNSARRSATTNQPIELNEIELNLVYGGGSSNYQLQSMMSSFNQARSIASSARKKFEDAKKSVLQNI